MTKKYGEVCRGRGENISEVVMHGGDDGQYEVFQRERYLYGIVLKHNEEQRE